jgi:hypothetical protein
MVAQEGHLAITAANMPLKMIRKEMLCFASELYVAKAGYTGFKPIEPCFDFVFRTLANNGLLSVIGGNYRFPPPREEIQSRSRSDTSARSAGESLARSREGFERAFAQSKEGLTQEEEIGLYNQYMRELQVASGKDRVATFKPLQRKRQQLGGAAASSSSSGSMPATVAELSRLSFPKIKLAVDAMAAEKGVSLGIKRGQKMDAWMGEYERLLGL